MRIAFYHTELSRDGPGLLLRDIQAGDDPQIAAVARVVSRADADVLVLAGIDWDLQGHALTALNKVIGDFPYQFTSQPNRGADSGTDFDGDGILGGPGDAYGYAEFPGKDGLAVLSKYPLNLPGLKDFTRMRWSDLPQNLSREKMPGMRLSTTAHWDLPVFSPDGTTLSLLIWHATPPVFDGPEDRNGRRNHDETAFWLQYLDGAFGSTPSRFVLLGAANLDVADGDGLRDALLALLEHERIRDPRPSSRGAVEAARTDRGVNLGHSGEAALDTVDWPDERGQPGNLRVDYVLPSSNLTVLDAGVIWPLPQTEFAEVVELASRHRLLWVDVALDLD